MSAQSTALLPYSAKHWWRRPKATDRPPLSWHVATRAFTAAALAVPRRHRFAIMRHVALALTPAFKSTPWFRRSESFGLNDPEEIVLHYLLNLMSNGGALFDLALKVEGGEVLEAALKKNKGTMIVLPHTLLAMTVCRYLHDLGRVPAIVAASPFVHIYGTRLRAPALQPAANLFFRLRQNLRNGGVACAMIDESPQSSSRTLTFETSNGPVCISGAVIDLALRSNAQVVFNVARLNDRGEIILTFGDPGSSISANPREIARRFVDFMQSHRAKAAACGRSTAGPAEQDGARFQSQSL
jgi:hypothetical protein